MDTNGTDVATLPLGKVLREYPVGKLIGLLSAVVCGAGFAGYWSARQIADIQLAAMTEKVAQSQRVADVLQQAINSSACVKSKALAQSDAARSMMARFEDARLDVEYMRADLKAHGGVPWHIDERFADPTQLGLFLNDPEITKSLSRMNRLVLQLNDAAIRTPSFLMGPNGQPPDNVRDALREPLRLCDEAQAAFTTARQYLKSKYLAMDPDVPSTP